MTDIKLRLLWAHVTAAKQRGGKVAPGSLQGVPPGTRPEVVIRTCFAELDRCKEENQAPFFLNMSRWVKNTRICRLYTGKYDEVPEQSKSTNVSHVVSNVGRQVPVQENTFWFTECPSLFIVGGLIRDTFVSSTFYGVIFDSHGQSLSITSMQIVCWEL